MYARHPFDSGASGGILINSYFAAITGNFYAIQIISAAVFASGGLVGNLGGDTYNGVTFPAGTTIFGNFSSIKLVSGTVIAYKS